MLSSESSLKVLCDCILLKHSVKSMAHAMDILLVLLEDTPNLRYEYLVFVVWNAYRAV